MKLLPGERILVESDKQTLVLTTHRVRYQTKAWGAGEYISIMLPDVCSVGLVSSSYPLLLVLAGVSALAGVLLGSRTTGSSPLLVGLGLAGVLIIAFLISRQHMIAISSAGHSIKVTARGMGKENVEKFLDDLQAAKTRYNLTAGLASAQNPAA